MKDKIRIKKQVSFLLIEKYFSVLFYDKVMKNIKITIFRALKQKPVLSLVLNSVLN
jgi:hypothetical protein